MHTRFLILLCGSLSLSLSSFADISALDKKFGVVGPQKSANTRSKEAAAPVVKAGAAASKEELKEIQRKLTGLKCKDSDSRWAQKRILQLIPLILQGEDVDYSAPDMKGNTCLHYACELGSRQLIHWLVENGADVNRVEYGGGNTPLHNAARLASLHTVTYLLEHGANPNVRNVAGDLPCDVVGKDDHDAICSLLKVKEAQKSNEPDGLSIADNLDWTKASQIIYANDRICVTENRVWTGYGKHTYVYTIYNNVTLSPIKRVLLSGRQLEKIAASPDGSIIAGLCLPSEKYEEENVGLLMMDINSSDSEIAQLSQESVGGAVWQGQYELQWSSPQSILVFKDAEHNGLTFQKNTIFKKPLFRNIKIAIKNRIFPENDGNEKLPNYPSELGLNYLPGGENCEKLIALDHWVGELPPYFLSMNTPNRIYWATTMGNVFEIDNRTLKEYVSSLSNKKIARLTPLNDGTIAVFHYESSLDDIVCKNGKCAINDHSADRWLICNQKCRHNVSVDYSVAFNGVITPCPTIKNAMVDNQSGVAYSLSGGIAEVGGESSGSPITLTYYYLSDPNQVRTIRLPEVTKNMVTEGVEIDFSKQILLADDVRYKHDEYDEDAVLKDKWESHGLLSGFGYQGEKEESCPMFGSCSAFSLNAGEINKDWSGWVPATLSGLVDCLIATAPEKWKIFATSGHNSDRTLSIVSPYNRGMGWTMKGKPSDVFVAWPNKDNQRVVILSAGISQASIKEYNIKTQQIRVIKEWYMESKGRFYWDNERKWLSMPQSDGFSVIHVSEQGDYEDVFRFQFFENGTKYAILLPDGRYTGSPGVEKYLHYTKNGIKAPMGVMMPWLKKPADILHLFGGDEEQAVALEAARERWLKKQHLSPTSPMPDLSTMPKVTVLEYPDLNTQGSKIDVPVRIQATKSAVKKLDIKVNEVAGPGIEVKFGEPIPAGETRDLSVRISLSEGLNWITCQAQTVDGLGGNIERFRVINCAKLPSDLYVVAMGVSDYASEDVPDLQLAAKDATDIASTFRKIEGGSKVLLLRDAEVQSSDALKKISAFLSSATLNDRVIVYCAGHGVLDGGEYYYAGSDFNPESAKETGISLGALKKVLSETNARQRLLLLDTCNSGSLGEEAEERLAMNAGALPSGVRAIQHRGMKVKAPLTSLNHAQKKRYIEELFLTEDFSEGVNIIGGSAAAEFAMESSEWNNGVFTASLLALLEQNKKYPTLPEIATYLQQRVRGLTRGAQSPSVRLLESGMGFQLKSNSLL